MVMLIDLHFPGSSSLLFFWDCKHMLLASMSCGTSSKWLRVWVITAYNFSHSKAGHELGDRFRSLHTGIWHTRSIITLSTIQHPRHFPRLTDRTQDPPAPFWKLSWRLCIPESIKNGIGCVKVTESLSCSLRVREKNNGCNKTPSVGNFSWSHLGFGGVTSFS